MRWRSGKQRPILYGPDYFDYGGSGLDPKPLADLGFSGFRLMDGQNKPTDWLAFQGASYFRSSGQDGQYGASARGIAINTVGPAPEEFPRFCEFWLEENGPVVTVYALLDGPSITGAYKFDAMKDGAVVMNVHCELFFRADIARLGVAPLTSMYWYGENERPKAADWRPEIHDSDGLALWTGKGERIWRPLINPPQVQTNDFQDSAPKGFGLMQRDRDFANYQDDGAFYNRRPGIWVEPKGDWGAGAVELVEIPDRGRDPGQYRRLLAAGAASCARATALPSTIVFTGRTASRPIPIPSPRWWRPGWDGAAFRARIPGRAMRTNSWWISAAER